MPYLSQLTASRRGTISLFQPSWARLEQYRRRSATLGRSPHSIEAQAQGPPPCAIQEKPREEKDVSEDDVYTLVESGDASEDELRALLAACLDTPLSRRQLLRIAGSATASAALLTAGLGATAQAAGIQWAKPPVTFVFVDTQEPSKFDPALQEEFDAFTVSRNIYDPLVWTDEARGELRP